MTIGHGWFLIYVSRGDADIRQVKRWRPMTEDVVVETLGR